MLLPRKFNNKNQKGQALLIVLLLMAVTLTIVLSVVSRSVTEVSVSSVESDALRAFSAAEAGVEDALLSGVSVGDSTPVTIDTDVDVSQSGTYVRDIYTPSTPGDTYVYPRELFSGETATFWLVSQEADGKLTCDGAPCFQGSQMELCWGNDGAEVPATEISIYYDESSVDGGTSVLSVQDPNDLSSVKVYRYAFDPGSVDAANNKFTAIPAGQSCSFDGIKYSTGKITLPAVLSCAVTRPCILAITARILYNETTPQQVGLKVHPVAGNSLPGQGIVIESTGQAGDSTRKVNVFRSYPEIPSMFNASVFSRKDLVR